MTNTEISGQTHNCWFINVPHAGFEGSPVSCASYAEYLVDQQGYQRQHLRSVSLGNTPDAHLRMAEDLVRLSQNSSELTVSWHADTPQWIRAAIINYLANEQITLTENV